jgi:hypothetical protein
VPPARAASELSPGARAAAEFVARNPGAILWRVVRAVQGSSAYDTARRKVQEAIDAGLIERRKAGQHVYLYPGGGT